MRRRGDPVGKLLLRSGAIDQRTLDDTLHQQRHTLPFASMCYVLGHADEETLARTLSRQSGVPAIVLDRSIIHLDVLAGIPWDLAIRHNLLPVLEDDRRIFIAAERPQSVGDLLRELQFVSGKTVVPHIALHVTLARTLRACYRARERGQALYVGPDAVLDDTSQLGSMVVVSDVDEIRGDAPAARAHDVVMEDVTKELVDADLVNFDVPDTALGIEHDFPTGDHDTPYTGETTDGVGSVTDRQGTNTPLSQIELMPMNEREEIIDLDAGGKPLYEDRGGAARILVVDDDFATRHLLVKELQPLGYITATASSGGEAIRIIKSHAPNLVVIDVMLPEVDGFQICRAIKQSRMYNHIPVILMSAVIDSGRVTDDVLRRYGADAYFEKPLNTDRIKRRIRELLRARDEVTPEVEDDSFERALEAYRSGDIERAMDMLRGGLTVDPLSAKHHFVLANLLQKRSMIYEAIDEYEATVDLKPDYFPALTRLAYLYYKKGFSAKAIDTWRRSLPHCPDSNLRQNIEVFMRKLIADLQSGI
jgi:CheY-like chemotaxis protein